MILGIEYTRRMKINQMKLRLICGKEITLQDGVRQNTHKCPVIEVIMGRIRVYKAVIRLLNWTLIRYVQ